MATVNINAGVKFTLFSTHFAAAMQKDDTGLKILLIPSVAEKKEEITIGDMVEEIKSLIAPNDPKNKEVNDMTKQLTSAVNGLAPEDTGGKGTKPEDTTKAFDPMSIGITIEEAFLYYEKKGTASTFEYAFSLSLNTSKLIKQMEVFSLDGISLSVWNTTRPAVIQEMKMIGIDDYLKQYPLLETSAG